MNFVNSAYKVTRKAILIGSPSNGERHLPGVNQDLKNLRYFLKSDNAGRWFDNEIVTLNNPSFQRLTKEVHLSTVDYLLIYFSGHGGTFDDNQRVLELEDAFIRDYDLLNTCPRQLIICDACSDHIGASIGAIPEGNDDNFDFDGSNEARELFNYYILNSPHGKTIVHSSQIGYSSFDSPNGGCFTLALLTASTQLKSLHDYTPFSIIEMLQRARMNLAQDNNPQIPTIYKEGDLQVPFVFGMQRKARVSAIQELQRQQLQATTASSSNGAIFFGLGILALTLMWED